MPLIARRLRVALEWRAADDSVAAANAAVTPPSGEGTHRRWVAPSRSTEHVYGPGRGRRWENKAAPRGVAIGAVAGGRKGEGHLLNLTD